MKKDAKRVINFLKLTEREKIIYLLRMNFLSAEENRSEMTLQEVGDYFGLTRERVRQIIIKVERRLNKGVKQEDRQKFEDYKINKSKKKFNRANSEPLDSYPVNHGNLWGEEEIILLYKFYLNGKDAREIAKEMNRTEYSISLAIERFIKLEPQYPECTFPHEIASDYNNELIADGKEFKAIPNKEIIIPEQKLCLDCGITFGKDYSFCPFCGVLLKIK